MILVKSKIFKGALSAILGGGKRRCWNASLYHSSWESHEQNVPLDWYKGMLPTMKRLSEELSDVDIIDGILVNVEDDSFVSDDTVKEKVYKFKSLAKEFIECSLVQTRFKEKMKAISANVNRFPVVPFSTAGEREGMVISSLTQVSNYLNVSSQKKQGVRSKICQQVTQHRIWAGALEEILNGLKLEMNSPGIGYSVKGMQMVEQIILSCLNNLADHDQLALEQGASSWMRLQPVDVDGPSCTWLDFYDMFNDLIRTLGREKAVFYHIDKLKAMKEGLYQVKDVTISKGMGYKEMRYQESLLSKKLSKSLGHPSPCLFTLILYYLYGQVRDPEVDLRGKLYGTSGGESYMVCLGRILTSDEEKMVHTVVKQLYKALGIFQLIWELAKMKEPLVVEGHLWCLGARERTISYRDNLFFVHEIGL